MMVKKEIKQNSSPKKPKNITFKLLIIAGFGALFYISYGIFNIIYKEREVNQEIAALQKEVETLNAGNQDLVELVNYLQTDEFKEKEAKDKLNLIKEGEELVLVKEKDIPLPSPEKEDKREAAVNVNRANYYWWWHYYFSI